MSKHTINVSLIIIQSLSFFLHCSAQIVSVPFRVGNKFGVSDLNGKMVIAPEFDWIAISNPEKKVLTAYKIENSEVLSSLIYHSKILLRDQKYSEYYLNNGLFQAIAYKIVNKQARHIGDRFIQSTDLFSIDGKKVLQGEFTNINVLHAIDPEEKLDEVLITTTSFDKTSALSIYSKTAKKIVKTIFSKASQLRMTDNSDLNYKNKSITFVLMDQNGSGRQLLIKNNGSALQVLYDKPAQLVKRQEEKDFDSFPIEAVPTHKFDINASSRKDSVSRFIQSFSVKGDYYFSAKRIEQLVNEEAQLNNDLLIVRDSKKGLRNSESGKFTVPLVYDDIIKGDFVGSGGFITKLSNKYGLCYYWKNKFVINKPVFDKIPLAITSFFDDGAPLVKLYDEDGRFFCYANHLGKRYYSAN